MLTLIVSAPLLLSAAAAQQPHPGDRFWAALQPMCGQAFEGHLVEGTEASDAAMGKARLVMHVRSCSRGEIRIPFHVGENRSRTWVITRAPTGLRLKHDHRHEDGTEEKLTQYGGDARTVGEELSLDFPSDAHTASLLPAAATNVWTLALAPGRTFTYALRREGSERRVRIEFDLTKPIPAPPAPW